ncbi:hypothetical protein FH968_23405, partial [Buttiauxella sp. B2]|uniref:Ig-like domain-containing protein n=1 Tax=Buttiauxella sp. B2 TaxID=2587812 RepID=UPI00111E9324
ISQPVIDTVQDNAGNTQGLVSNGGLTDDNRPVLTGHAEAGSRVDIHVFGPGGKELYHQSVTAGNDGSWTYQPEAFTTHGNYSFGITGVDQAGNAWRDYGDKFTVKYVGSNQDADAPDTATNIQVYDDVGTLQGDLANGSTTDDNHPTISGNATAGDLIMISDNGKAIGSVTVDSKGHWSFTPTTALSNAEHSITAVVKDPVTGKVSDATEAFHFTVETQAPLVSGHEYFEGGSDDSTDTLVFASGLQVSNVGDSYLSVISSSFRAEDPNNSKQTILGDNHASGISNQGGEGGILFTLPGAAQTISFDYAVAQSLTIYDTNHNVIAHMVPDYNNGSGSGVIGDAISTDYSWCHFEYTAPQGVTIGSFSVDSGFSWVDNVNWSTSGSTSPWSQSTDINNEAFDLTNHAHNTLALSYNDVITHAEQNLYIQDGKEQFAIKGDNGDVLQLKVADFDHDSWINTGSVSAGVVQYDVYQHAGDNLEMLIQHGVQLHQVI